MCGGIFLSVETDHYNEYAALLNQCDKERDDIYHDYALKHNLSDAALWIFYVLYDSKDGVTQSEICESWYYSRQTINTALKGMEQQGIVELAPAPGSRKSKKVFLTGIGKTMAEKVVVPMKRAEAKALATFSNEENKLLVELTQKRCFLLREFLKTE